MHIHIGIENDYEHYYCISKNDSFTSSQQFLDFCNEFNLNFEKSELSCVNKNSVEFCLKVKESIYDPEKLKEFSWKKLKENNIVGIVGVISKIKRGMDYQYLIHIDMGQ